MQPVDSYIRTQGIICAAINAALNPVVAWLVYRQLDFVLLWGRNSIVADTAVTSVVLTLLVTLFTTSSVRQALQTRRVKATEGFPQGGTSAFATTPPCLVSWTAAWAWHRLRPHPAHVRVGQCAWFFRTSFGRVHAVQGYVYWPAGVYRDALGDPAAAIGLVVQPPSGRQVVFQRCQYILNKLGSDAYYLFVKPIDSA